MKMYKLLITIMFFGLWQITTATSFKCANYGETCYCNGDVYYGRRYYSGTTETTLKIGRAHV